MKFTIITPSYNQLDFLKRCMASVRDQAREGVGHEALGVGKSKPLTDNTTSASNFNLQTPNLSVHHHIQDGGSTDGTVEFLKEFQFKVDSLQFEESGEKKSNVDPDAQRLKPSAYSFSFSSEKDEGMYDAINRGFKLAIGGSGDQALGNNKVRSNGSSAAENLTPGAQRLHVDSVIAWLNCDEQYLPGALEKVARWFSDHPQLDICFGDVLVVDGKGQLICGRRMVRPSRYHIVTDQLPLYSAAMFIRAGALKKYRLFPDAAWKNTGDVELILRMLSQGVRYGFLNEYISAFTDTGENLALDDQAAVEYDRLRQTAPWWVRRLRVLWVLNHRIRKLRAGCYHLEPLDYSIYIDSLSQRHGFSEARPESRWLSRL